MKVKASFLQTAKWILVYAGLVIGMLWLHDPFTVSMNAAESAVTFVYQQF